MAQLVKLQDYISRYQIDLTRYPTQFVRLKKSQWDRVQREWESGGDIREWEQMDVTEALNESPRKGFFSRFLRAKKKPATVEELETMDVSTQLQEDDIIDEETQLHFEPNIVYSPQTLLELKRMFMDQFFQFQMKWASSTLREKSYVDPKYMRDTLLRSFLQSLPDSYLVFYEPILRLKKAPIELETIIMTPTDCYVIKVLEQEEQAVFVGSSERFWVKKVGKLEKKTLNPTIDLNRTETIVSQLFKLNDVEMPIRKVILSRNGYIDYPGNAYGIQFVDKRKFPEWMEQMKRSISPMKHMQIRAAQAILNTAETTSFNRDIWHVQPEGEIEQN